MDPNHHSTARPGDASTLLHPYIQGERGRKLRSELARRHPGRSADQVEDAIQTACNRFLEKAEGISTPGQVYSWIRTTAHNALCDLAERYEHEVAVDPTRDPSLTGAATEEPTPDEELIAAENEEELAELVQDVARALPERRRSVLALYGSGCGRPEIATRLGLREATVKHDLEAIMGQARSALARRAGGGCEGGEAMVTRFVCGLATRPESEQARRHLSRCRSCELFSERFAAWREKVPAALPFPAADQASPGVLERAAHKIAEGASAFKQQIFDGGAQLKQHAAAGYYRAADPTPLAAARPGTVAAVVAGCITLGGGATYCVEQGVDPLGATRGLIASSEEEERQPEEPPPEPAEAPPPPVEPPVEEEEPVAEEAPPPVEVEVPAPEPPPPPPPPEQTFQPSSPNYPAVEASTSESSSTASNAEPAPVPAGSSSEFKP